MRNAFKYLSQYSTAPIAVDRLIISAFLEINNLKPKKNKCEEQYSAANVSRHKKLLRRLRSLLALMHHAHQTASPPGAV